MWVKESGDYFNIDAFARLNVGQHVGNKRWYIYGTLPLVGSQRFNSLSFETEEEARNAMDQLVPNHVATRLNVQGKSSPERAEALKPLSSGKSVRKTSID